MLLLIIASLLSVVPFNALPLVIVSAVPERAVVSVVPTIDTGGVKLVGKLPPPDKKKRPPPPPLVFIVTGEVRLVCPIVEDDWPGKEGVEEPMVVSRSVRFSVRLVTCGSELTLDSSLVVSELLTELEPLNPAGAILTVLATELLISVIFCSTACLASSMVRLRPILIPSMLTIETVRIVFRNAFR